MTIVRPVQTILNTSTSESVAAPWLPSSLITTPAASEAVTLTSSRSSVLRGSTAGLRQPPHRPPSVTEAPGRGREERPRHGEARCRDNPTPTLPEEGEEAVGAAEEERAGLAVEEGEGEEEARVGASEATTAAMRVIPGRGLSHRRLSAVFLCTFWSLTLKYRRFCKISIYKNSNAVNINKSLNKLLQ